MPAGAVARRKRTDEAFHAALAQDDPVALYERAPVGYLSTTPDGLIVKANETFLAWTGYQLDDLVGRRTFADLLTAGGRIYHETHYAPMLHMHGGVHEIALDIKRADGDRLPVLVNARLERDEGGQPRVIRVALLDATERREYELELLRATRRAEASEARAKALARTLQQTFVPPRPPRVPMLDVAGVYHPADNGLDIGGDFFDVFELADGDWIITLGDVCGKGVGAAVVTSLVRHTIRALAIEEDSPCGLLERLNEVLLAEATDRFCTVVLLWLRRTASGWHVRLCTAGHPPALLVRPDGAISEVGRSGTLLGVLASTTLEEVELDLTAGSALVLYTDGVTEARRGREWFGRHGLVESVRRHRGSASSVAGGLVDDAVSFQRNAARDDIAVVALQVPDELS